MYPEDKDPIETNEWLDAINMIKKRFGQSFLSDDKTR